MGAGANVDAPSKNGRTPLMAAAQKGNLAIVQCLLDHGAEINAQDHYGKTARWFAAKNGRSEVAEFLRQHGATA